MKKIMMLVAACLLIASLAACGKKNNDNNGQTGTPPAAEDNAGTAGTDNGGMDAGTDGTDTETGSGETQDDTAGDTVENDDAIADAVSSLEDVDHATVLKVNDAVYVGATLKEGIDSTQDLDGQIADTAKEASGDVEKVYVSTNPDFAKEIDDYSEKIRNGEPVEGLFEEIGDAMTRMFPDAH